MRSGTGIILFLFMLFRFSAFSQSEQRKLTGHDFLFTRNHFVISLDNGLSVCKLTANSGNIIAKENAAGVHQLSITHAANINNKFEIATSAGFGLYPLFIRVPHESWYLFRYWDNLDVMLYWRLATQLNYRFKIKPKYFHELNAGISVIKLPELNSGIGYTQTGVNGVHLFDYDIIYHSEKAWRPAVNIGIGHTIILRNYDFLSFNLMYQHTFNDFYSGQYRVIDENGMMSKGSFINKGRVIGISTKYTYTKAQKQARLVNLSNKMKQKDEKEIKKIYKEKQRKVFPVHTTFLGLSGGPTFQPTYAKDAQGVLEGGLSLSLSPYFRLEHYIKKYIWLEAGWTYVSYWTGERIKKENECLICGTYDLNFATNQISIGAGKEIRGQHNFNYLNVNAGISFSHTDTKKGLSGWGHYMMKDNSDTILYETSQDIHQNRFFPMVYIGFSKDVRIRGKLYFSAIYRYHQGFYSVSKRDLQYVSKWTTGTQNAILFTNGSYHVLQLGLKYNMGDVFKLTKETSK